MTVVPLNFQYGPLTRENFTKAYFQQWVPRHPIDQSILHLVGHKLLSMSKMTWVVNVEPVEDIIE